MSPVTDNASHSTAFSESQVSHCQPFSQLLTAALMITLSKGQSLLSAKMCLAHKNQKNNNIYKSVERPSGLQFSFQTYFVHWVPIHIWGSAAARESSDKAHCHAAPNSQALTLGSQVLKGHCKEAECNKRNERIGHVHSSNESMVTRSIAMKTLYLSFTMQGNHKRITRIHLRITPGTTSHHNVHMLMRTWERHEPSGTSYHFSIKSG